MNDGAILRMTGIHKRYGALVALSGVELEVARGEVHALVGENGAGKSTLMKVLSGAERPDAGTMELAGAPYAPRGPLDARRSGVAMVYQELNLALDLTVGQNLFLGHETARFGVVSRRAQSAAAERVLAILAQPDLRADAPVRELGPGARQLVEIARALAFDCKLVVLDEPTSSLSSAEVRVLDGVLARLRERGVSVVYITHFLEEVERLAARYTVLRDGKTVATGTVAGTKATAIVAQMVGRPLDEIYPPHARTPGETVLELEACAGAKLPIRASLALRRGEVLGIAGLVGAGRTELLRALVGLDRITSGQVVVRGARDGGAPISVRIAQGMGLLSEDRKNEGVALDRPIADNVMLTRDEARFGVLRVRARAARVRSWIEKLAIRASGPGQRAGDLSGGNQQKVALARLLQQDADVLLLDEPTRGVDVGSKAEIYARIDALCREGKAVLVVSSYLPELLGIADRIAVMRKGVLGAARPVSAWTEASLLEAATLESAA
ncbi:MAG: sugar ABC transporter ATP-binding protein [Sandaracinus sp.]